MSRRMPTPEQLEVLRDAFRRSPPSAARDFKAAAGLAGVSEVAARRAYARGWPGIDSIEQQLAKERHLQAQSAEVLKVERVVKAMKTNVVHMQNEVLRLQPAVRALVGNLIGSLEDLAVVHPEMAVKMLQRIAKVQKDVASVSAKAVELDRLIAGEATSIVGHKPMAAESVDLEAAQEVSDRLARALRRAQDANDLDAKDAGPTEQEPDVSSSHVN